MRAGAMRLLHLLQGRRAAQIHAMRLETGLFKVHVGVVEAGHDEVTAEIDDLRVRALQLANVVVGADGNDAAIAHRDGLRASRHCLGIDIAVDEDDVGGLAGGFPRRSVG